MLNMWNVAASHQGPNAGALSSVAETLFGAKWDPLSLVRDEVSTWLPAAGNSANDLAPVSGGTKKDVESSSSSSWTKNVWGTGNGTTRRPWTLLGTPSSVSQRQLKPDTQPQFLKAEVQAPKPGAVASQSVLHSSAPAFATTSRACPMKDHCVMFGGCGMQHTAEDLQFLAQAYCGQWSVTMVAKRKTQPCNGRCQRSSEFCGWYHGAQDAWCAQHLCYGCTNAGCSHLLQ